MLEMLFPLLSKKLRWILFGYVVYLGVIGIDAKIIGKMFVTDIDPDPSTSSFLQNYINLNTSKAVGKSYGELTYCFRWLLKFANQHCLFWEKNIGFWFENPIDGFGFLMINGLTFMFRLQEGMVPYTWNGICVLYQAYNNHIELILNDYTVLNDSFPVLSKLASNKVTIESNFELGKCRYTDNADPLKKIARVTLQDFNIWSTALSTNAMFEFTSKCEAPYTITGTFTSVPDIINWDSLDIIQQGSMVSDTKETAKHILCGSSAEETTLAIPMGLSYPLSRLTCYQLGGRMIYPTSKRMLNEMNSDYRESNKDTKYAIKNRFNLRNSTQDNDEISISCNYNFWMPIKQQEKTPDQFTWWSDTDETTKEVLFMPWKLGQPNGLGDVTGECVRLKLQDKSYIDEHCDTRFCHLCTFNDKQIFNIRGLGSNTELIKYDDKEFWIDRTYVFLPTHHKKAVNLRFLGYSQTEIKWTFDTNEWIIKDKRTNEAFGYPISSGINPIGKHTWRFKLSNDTDNKLDLEMKFTQV